jgi:hypothetical protein
MTEKPPHPPHQAKHPGRSKVAPHKRNTFQQDQHTRAMKRPGERLHIAKHCLHPHVHHGDPKKDTTP